MVVSNKVLWNGWLERDQLDRVKAVAKEQKTSIAWAFRRAIDIAYPAKSKSKRAVE